jgi:DNA-binding response OmpR family regulator
MDKSILLIGADRDLIDLLRHAFTLEGYKVLTAFDAKSVRRILKTTAPQLIIEELITAGEEGLEILDLVRRHSINPIMFLARPSDEASIKAAFELGADAYLAVPFRPSDLKTGAQALLNWTRDLQQTPQVSPPILRGIQSHKGWLQVSVTRRRAGLAP